MTNSALDGKPYAGNPHVRIDEGDGASAKPRRSSLLYKTKVLSRTNGTSRVAVTAHGFRGEDRVEYVEVYGGDGSYHQVPVKWVEYLPVQQTREMFVSEGDSPAPDFAEAYRTALKSAFRRSVYSYLVP